MTELRTGIAGVLKWTRREDLPLFLSRAITLTVGIYIFVIPFPYRTALQEICFYSALAFLALLYVVSKPSVSFKTPMTASFLLFSAWVFVSLFFSMNKENSFHDYFAYLMKDLALFFLVYNTFNSRSKFTLLTWLIIVSAGIFSIGGMIYFYLILKMPLAERMGLPEVGLGVNYIGYVTVLALSFSVTHLFYFRTRFGALVSVLSGISATLATMFAQTKGTLLGFLPLLVIFSARKKILVLVSITFALIMLAMPVRQQFTDIFRHMENDRPMIWYYYAQIIKDNPVTGIGFGMQTYKMEHLSHYLKDNPTYYNLNLARFYAPHNTFIDVAVRCGLPGLLFFLYILFAFARTGIGIIKKSRSLYITKWSLCIMTVIASYLIQGFLTDLLLGIQVKYFFILLAMMAILWKWHAEDWRAAG